MGSDARGRRRLLIVDGHKLYREAVSMLLSQLMPDLTVFEESGCQDDPALAAGFLDVVLLFLKSPYKQGLSKLLELRNRFPVTPVILLSEVADNKVILMARIRGANGLIHVSESTEDLLAAMHDVLAGKLVFTDEDDGKKELKPKDFQLSLRQGEVFDLLCKGMTNKEIGISLHLSDNTVRTHVSAIFDILDVRNRTEAVIIGRHLL